ncbi:very short patch repair endonuclease [Aminobacterium mobile]
MKRDPHITSRIMSAIKSKDTKPEQLLGKALWRRGLRYRKHYKKLEGCPDFAFISAHVAVFCDGDFWHGNNWRLRNKKSLEDELSSYSPFWQEKIRRNIERDIEINKKLASLDWIVVRFWASQIIENAEACASTVEAIINSGKNHRLK